MVDCNVLRVINRYYRLDGEGLQARGNAKGARNGEMQQERKGGGNGEKLTEIAIHGDENMQK